MRIAPVLLFLLGCSSDEPAAQPDAGPPPPRLGVDLAVVSRFSNSVLRFDGSGAPAGIFGTDPLLTDPVGITFGPDGNLYVSVLNTDRVLRFDGKTGASMGLFTAPGAVTSARNVNFGPDGNFYVADGMVDKIYRFAPGGDFIDVFIQDPAINGLLSFTFGPDGNVYVVSVLTGKILKFDGHTGAPAGEFARSNLLVPRDVAFGPDGNLYVVNSGNHQIQRFRGDTGDFIDTFAEDPNLITPFGLTWGPDGNLYVANLGRNEVRRYDGRSGGLIDSFVKMDAGSVTMPSFIAFFPTDALALSVGWTGALVVQGAQPGGKVLIVRGAAGGSGSVAACPALALPVGSPVVDQTRSADEAGATVVKPAGGGSFVAVDAARCAASAPVTL